MVGRERPEARRRGEPGAQLGLEGEGVGARDEVRCEPGGRWRGEALLHWPIVRRTARYPPGMDPLEDAPPLDDEDGDEPEAPRAVTNGDLARIFHEIGDILEVKGELVFKTVAYHRAADAIARAPFDVAATYARGRAPADPRRRRRDRRQDHRARDDRPHGVLREAARRDPADARGPAAHPRRRAQDRAHRLGGARDRGPPGLEAGGPGGHAPDAQGHLGEHGGADPRGHREARDAPAPAAIHRAQATSDDLVEQLRGVPGVTRIVQAGSLRRRRESIGDLDLLVETADPTTVIEPVHAPRRRGQGRSARAPRRRRSRSSAGRRST